MTMAPSKKKSNNKKAKKVSEPIPDYLKTPQIEIKKERAEQSIDEFDMSEKMIFAKFDITPESIVKTIYPNRSCLVDLLVQRSIERHRQRRLSKEYLIKHGIIINYQGEASV